MEARTKDIIADLYALRSKQGIIDFIREHYDLLIEFFKGKGYKIVDNKIKGSQAIWSGNDKRLFDHYEEVLYLLRGVEQGTWPENITNEIEKERYREIREEAKEVLGGYGENSEIFLD